MLRPIALSLIMLALAVPAAAQELSVGGTQDAKGDPCWVIDNVRGADVDRSDAGQARVGIFRLTCVSESGTVILQEPTVEAVCRQNASGLWVFQGAWLKRPSKQILILDLPDTFGCFFEYQD